jgi:arylsulfatase A-like enzyme
MKRLFGCDYCVQAALRGAVIRIVPTADLDNRTLAAGNINRRLFRLLDEVKSQDRQFFLFVNYMDAHEPYVPPPPFDTRYPYKDESSVWQYSELQNNVLKLEQVVTQRQRRHLISHYDGAIAYLDFHLGKLSARLKELDLYDNCLLIVTSDHGEAFGERNLLGHTVSVYQDQIHVPLIIKYPGIRRKVVVEDVVSLVDLMPTVLDVLDHEAPAGVQGQSLLKPKPGKRREVISESFSVGPVRALHPRFRRVERAIFVGPLKLISSTNGKRELYDLSKDPHEQRNLYNSGDSLSQQLEGRLAKWMNSIRPPRGQPAELDRETLDRLKSLGYIQ